ncbi:transposase [Flaviaesturariibacter flavus]|uniref:Transposase n=1 Tax=Flaviaesturariibacter flavus TaxID=2502780 RepID=A0A4R1BIH2_9BACT|nr:transposase [Flaviaesturariibacter flavus]TCJ17080.1 transposase [Flaviaesturariibacter flavus]
MSYKQIYLHIVFAVEYRRALILDTWRPRLHQYSISALEGRRHKVIAINSIEDHLHLLLGHWPSDPLPDLMRDWKSNCTVWINREGFTERPFAWQEGYAAISVSPDIVGRVAGYIGRQREHHKRQSFRNEITGILDAAGIEWKPEYLFTEPKDG